MKIQRSIDRLREIARSGRCRLAAAVSLVLLSACCDKGVNHEPVQDLVYVFEVGSTSILVLDADSLTVVDSIPNVGYWSGASEINHMIVTPDGRWLFTSDAGNSKGITLIRKIDTITKRTVDSLYASHGGVFLFLDEGKLLRWGSCDGWFTSADEFPVVRADTDSVCAPRGPISGLTVAGAVMGTNHIRVETVNPRRVLAEFPAKNIDGIEVPSVGPVALHPDHKRLSAIVSGLFIVADVATGRTVYQHAVRANVPGEGIVNSRGTLAVVTDPGKPWFGEFIGTIDVVDLVNLKLLKRFDRDYFGEPQTNSQIAFTSDEEAVIVTTIANWGFPYIHRIDLGTLEITKTTYVNGIVGMAVGRKPNN